MARATRPPDLIDRYDITELLGITMLQFGSLKKKPSFSAAREPRLWACAAIELLKAAAR